MSSPDDLFTLSLGAPSRTLRLRHRQSKPLSLGDHASSVWESGVLLADLVLSEPWPLASRFGALAGRRALDLGAGTGIASIALALAGVDVVCTDLPHALDGIGVNLAANGFVAEPLDAAVGTAPGGGVHYRFNHERWPEIAASEPARVGTVRVVAYRWGDAVEPILALAPPLPPRAWAELPPAVPPPTTTPPAASSFFFDFIVGTDVVYSKYATTALARCASRLALACEARMREHDRLEEKEAAAAAATMQLCGQQQQPPPQQQQQQQQPQQQQPQQPQQEQAEPGNVVSARPLVPKPSFRGPQGRRSMRALDAPLLRRHCAVFFCNQLRDAETDKRFARQMRDTFDTTVRVRLKDGSLPPRMHPDIEVFFSAFALRADAADALEAAEASDERDAASSPTRLLRAFSHDGTSSGRATPARGSPAASLQLPLAPGLLPAAAAVIDAQPGGGGNGDSGGGDDDVEPRPRAITSPPPPLARLPLRAALKSAYSNPMLLHASGLGRIAPPTDAEEVRSIMDSERRDAAKRDQPAPERGNKARRSRNSAIP